MVMGMKKKIIILIIIIIIISSPNTVDSSQALGCGQTQCSQEPRWVTHQRQAKGGGMADHDPKQPVQ